MIAGESSKGGRLIRGDEKISLQEIDEFMTQISAIKAPKVNKKDLSKYLSAFPQKHIPGKEQIQDPKANRSQVNFLMDGKQEMEAQELFELLSKTQIEDFDEVEEAFKLLDVDQQGYLTLDAFKSIFEKLELGKIEK